MRTQGSSGRAELVDAAFLVGLTLLALIGFKASYAGWTFFALGGFGLALGIALATLSRRLGQPVLVVGALTVLAFFLGGGVSAPNDALAGFLPSPASVKAMALTTVQGWKELLTTFRPIGTTGALLCIPYLLGLLAGVIGHTAARRTTITALALAPPAAVMALGILFGSPHPQSLVLQGSGFAALAIGWASLRSRRNRIAAESGNASRHGLSGRLAASALLIAAAGGLSIVVGPALPFANAHTRKVLNIEPPFDPGAYPSPLSGFRAYSNPKGAASLYDKVLLTVAPPVPIGALVKIATMDSYDDIAWGVADESDSGNQLGGFAKVGTTVPDTEPGQMKTISFAIGSGYSNVWLPSIGALSAVHFEGPRAHALTTDLRYNAVSETGIEPSGLTSGDVVRETATVPQVLTTTRLADATPERAPTLPITTYGSLATVAQRWSQQASNPATAVANIAEYLYKHGRFSNGDDNTGTLAGNSLGRLITFAEGRQIAGNDEQYAATMALMANAVGMPARVVLGATVPSNGVVEGKDVGAWVELDVAGSGWTMLPSAMYEDKNKRAVPQPKAPREEAATKPVPPPVNAPPASRSQDPNNASAPSAKSAPHHRSSVHVPGILAAIFKYAVLPLLVILAIAGAIVAAKAGRRRRRRRRGSPRARVTAGWRELVDSARDLGIQVSGWHTRREQARGVDATALIPLARIADAASFSTLQPTEADAAHYWQALSVAVDRLRSQVPRRRRIYAAVNLGSLYSGARAARHRNRGS